MRSESGTVVVVGDGVEATYVEFGLRELVERLGPSATLVPDWSAPAVQDADVVVAVGGRALAAAGVDLGIAADDPGGGKDGYVVDVAERDGTPVVCVAGGDPQGIKYALLHLVRHVDAFESPADLDRLRIRTTPAFELRGMYAHLHWSYERPYALRSWTLKDWRDYVDLLSHFGANLLQIWPMLSLMPDPLNEGDEAYLRMLSEVIDYAHEARGMQVWVGECANNLAATDHGQPISQRQYFGTERLVDPGTPEGMAEIVAARRNLYRLLSNADGYWIIDSDPGQWAGSPSSEFVEIVVQNQRLAHEFNPGARIAYWMHVGWGTGAQEENYRDTLAGLAERLDEPWSILLGAMPRHLDAAKEVGVADRAVFFPYGVVEGEPSNPLTLFDFDVITDYLRQGIAAGMTRGMAQAQTPIVQLPKIWYMLRALWDPSLLDQSPTFVFDELAPLLYRDSGSIVAEAWRAMYDGDAEALNQSRHALRKAVDEGLGHPGEVGRCLFGDPGIVARDLLALIEIKAEGAAFREAVFADRAVAVVQEHFQNYLRAALRWADRHGYVPMGGTKFVYGAYLQPAAEGWAEYLKRHGVMHTFPELLWIPKTRLIEEGEFHWALIDGILTEVVLQPRLPTA